MPQSDAPDFFDQHLSKMLVAPSFEQGPPALHANAGWQPECAGTQPDSRLRAQDSETSTQSSDGRHGSAQVHPHTDRHHSASSSGDTDGQAANAFGSKNSSKNSNAFASHNANAFASTNAAGYGGSSVPPTAPQHHVMPAPPPPAPPAEFDAMASMPAPPPMGSSSRRAVSPTPMMDPMSSQVMPTCKYKVGDEIEVWSNSHKRWSRGTIEKVDAGGKVSAKYSSPDGAAMIKQMPEHHEHLRHYVIPDQTPAPQKQAAAVAHQGGVYKVGDQIEIWSNSQNAWCRGSVLKIEGELVNVKYTSGDGQAMTKLMPNGHEYLRHLQKPQKAVPPPPPPPGRSPQHMEGVPPPLAESAGREDSDVMGTIIETYDQAPSGVASMVRVDDSYSSAVASGMNGGTPMASAAPQLKTKGYRAANSKPPQEQACQRDDIFVAESTSWVPSGSMALCGMPIKANKKQEVALNDDGTPVARCQDIDRCCRCSMPVGSYFEHTCPRCTGIVCLACLDDVKYIIGSYRCPCCGDQQFNQEALKQTLWYLNGYRTAQRTVTAVPIIFAGLFGFGPEGSTRRAGANPACAVEEEEPEPVIYQRQGPPAAKAKGAPQAAKGPPPAPPRPKAGSKDVPEYHTRPPANWAEGAGGYNPGQAAGSSDPATVAAAMHQAHANQSASRRSPEAKPAGQGQSRNRAGSSDSRAGQQQQTPKAAAGLQQPNLFASVNNNAPPMAPQRGGKAPNGAQSPFSTRIPPDQLTASPMR